MDYSAAIERVYDHLENDDVDKAVMGCMRIARHLNDHLSAAVFFCEMAPTRDQLVRTIAKNGRELSDERKKYIFERSLVRWSRNRAVGGAFGQPDDGDDHILVLSISQLDKRMALLRDQMNDLKTVNGLLPATSEFLAAYLKGSAGLRQQIEQIEQVKQRVKAECFQYVSGLERQLEAQRKPSGFLEACQNEVNNYFKDQSDDVYKKLLKAAQLIDSTDLEDMSLLLTQVRRAMHAVADHLFPPQDGDVLCADGKKRTLGNDQYLNRINEYLSVTFRKSASRKLLEEEFNHLSSFIRRLNELASKGVHSDVSAHEAKQGLIGLYMFLFNVVTRLQREEQAQ